MNKMISKEIFKKNKILTPKYLFLKKEFSNHKKILKNKLQFPVVIKPIDEGSSIGVKISKSKSNLINHAKVLFKKYDELMVDNLSVVKKYKWHLLIILQSEQLN